MKDQDESRNKKELTIEQHRELMIYPSYLRGLLQSMVEENQISIKEAYKEVKASGDGVF